MPSPSTPPPTHAGTTTVPPALSTLARFADYAVMTMAVVLSAGSIALLAWGGRPILLRLDWSTGAAVTWNAAVSFLFFAQHSLTVRRSFRARLAAVIPARYDAAFYAITSGLTLAVVVALWQPPGSPLIVLEGVAKLAVSAVALLAAAGFLWGIIVLDTFDLCGLRPIRAHLRGQAAPAMQPFVVRGPYRWVRHPLYSAIIVLLWARAETAPGHLVIAALWTAWICVGAVFEERDLVADFGDEYRRYQARVPMLIPWRGRAQ